MTQQELKKTSLYNEHVKLKAKFAPFAGYDMPIQYDSVKEEALTIRNDVGVFDVSHMGEFFVTGEDTNKFIDKLITNKYENVEIGKAVYSPLCRENGTVIDDLIVYKLEQNRTLICVNASNIEKDWEWITEQKEKLNFNVAIKNLSNDYSLIAIQGKNSEKILKEMKVCDEALSLSTYCVIEKKVENENIIIARTGYTGEDGFEIFASDALILKLWEKLQGLNVKACGLAARDLLRIEACFPLYGHEISDNVTPLDSALKWTVKFEKESFIGMEALKNYVPKLKLVKVSIEKGVPRMDHPILISKGENDFQQVGVITSGTHSILLNKGIALGHINSDIDLDKHTLYIQIRKNIIAAKLHQKSFLKGNL